MSKYEFEPFTKLDDLNPKDAVGQSKPGMSAIPATVLMELAVAMLEGARKYGRHNFRVSRIKSSIYYDAVLRHITSWWEGEDIDPDSGLSHITKAIASLTVLRDAMINEMIVDDRPPKAKAGWNVPIYKQNLEMMAKYKDAKPIHTEIKND